MEERFAVTAATGALGPVLVKLTALLGDEYKLHEKTREDILFIKSELDRVHDLLVKIWGRLDLNVACKDWMTEARELSYDMEDDIDSFTLGLEFMGDGSFIQRETTDGPFKELMKIGDAIICNDGSKLSTDPRALFLHKDASELVGMEEKEEELIKLLQKHEMVCIVGPGGMGKTTLADLVYHAVGDEFQCRAFVSVHPSPNMMEIMGAILSQVRDGVMSAGSGTEPAAEQNMINSISISLSEKSGTEHAAEQYDFIKGISTFLSDKRYLIIIDDIWHWEEWEVILKALPQNNLDRKLMMTTRVRSIAGKCSTEQGAHVYEQKFGYEESERLSAMRLSESVKGTNAKELPTLIADMCDEPPFHCCPLAVICLSSAWAESHNVQGDDGEWDTWASHVLDDGFLSTPSLKPLVQSLCLGFDDLPVQLRTCLLYCTIYPPEYMFYKGCLLRKWIAEGFVSQVEVAEAYFDKLASRNLLLMCMGKYTVDHIMRAFLVRKGEEDNFIAYYYHGPSDSSHGKQIRRLSLSTDRCLDEDVLSHIRSLVVCGKQWQLDGVPFKAFKKLRVLEIRDRSGLENDHLVDVCGLMRLKYLCLGNCDQITELPREIGRLQNLETLDVRGTCVGKLPTEIGKLQHLRTLDIRGTKVREVSFIEDPNSLLSVVVDTDRFYGHKVKLPLGVISSSGGEAKYRKYLSILILINHFSDDRCDVGPVRMLRVAGRHMKVPQWVKQYLCNVSSLDIRLCKLVEEDLEFLKTQMPNLHALQLRFEVLPREPVSITRGGFPKLEIFYIDCRLPRVINFKEGAMPKLKHLEFKFYSGPATSQDYSMGIMCLSSLQRVVFRCSEYYTSDGPGISATIEVVRKEAAQHPNKITLYINDMDPEVFGSGAEWLSQANKATIRKEIEERERIRQQINRKEIEERERIRKQRDRLYSAAKRRAQQEKNNARGRIHS